VAGSDFPFIEKAPLWRLWRWRTDGFATSAALVDYVEVFGIEGPRVITLRYHGSMGVRQCARISDLNVNRHGSRARLSTQNYSRYPVVLPRGKGAANRLQWKALPEIWLPHRRNALAMLSANYLVIREQAGMPSTAPIFTITFTRAR
jgi:hypothetical protein